MFPALLLMMSMALETPPSSPMQAIIGDWVTSDESAIVRLFACNDEPESLCGNMIWIADPEWVEDRFLGGEIIADFRFDRGAWRKGHLTNPEDGNVYRGSISLQDEGQLKLKGCALRVLCKNEMWKRLEALEDIGASSEELLLDRLPNPAGVSPLR